jgi:cytochrome c-type biogenesis protein CcmH
MSHFSGFPRILGGLLLVLLLASPVLAQEATPGVPVTKITDDEVNAIAKDMYCPVCENVPLDVCPTQACAQWRELIRQRLGEGWTEQQIKNYFVQQHGDRVLAEPPRTGLNWLVYVIPPILVLAGVLIVGQVLRSWKLQTTQIAATQSPPTLDDDYVRRLEEELKKRDQT